MDAVDCLTTDADNVTTGTITPLDGHPLGTGALPDVGKHGVVHRPRAGVCLEPQQYPNAMNCPAFPLNRVAVGRPYRARTVYRFGLLKP